MNHSRRSSNDPSADPVVGRPRGDSHVDRSALTSWASRSSMHAPSFQAADDAGTEAFPFPPLTDSPTSPRSASARRSVAPSSLRNNSPPRPDMSRRPSQTPSIRIRRRSNASLRAPAERSSFPDFAAQTQADPFGSTITTPNTPATARQQVGRPRSSSHPERGEPRYDANIARHSRAVPQVAMPRLTEEGTRPTLEELGVTPSPAEHPLSPVQSLPQQSAPRHEQQHPADVGMVRKMSRFFRPGHGNANPPQDTASLAPAGSQYADTEYDDHLVDYLDIVGT